MNQDGVRRWTADAPSNIALIKYMGKVEGEEVERNRPTNTSLSFTLPHLRSFVQLEFDSAFQNDTWEPLLTFGDREFKPMELSEKGLQKFLGHLAFLKTNLISQAASRFDRPMIFRLTAAWLRRPRRLRR